MVVALLKSPRADQPYAETLASAGMDVVFVPVLRYEFRPAARLRAVAEERRWGSMALTSPRAVEAVARARLVEVWAGQPVYGVGPATASLAGELGLPVVPTSAGTAVELVAQMLADGAPGPVLFPCGNRRRDDLPDRLRGAGREVVEVVAYESHALAPRLPEPLPDWAVFFSPSGVAAASTAPDFPWNSLQRAAIGPTTAEALVAVGWPPHATAEEPSPVSLAVALQSTSAPTP